MTDEAAKPRGRPRPLETIQRDNLIEKLLRGSDRALTRNEIADLLGEDRHLVYLSLWRLREEGRVRRPDATGLRNHWAVP